MVIHNLSISAINTAIGFYTIRIVQLLTDSAQMFFIFSHLSPGAVKTVVTTVSGFVRKRLICLCCEKYKPVTVK